MIDSCASLVWLTFRVTLLFFSFVLALWLLRHYLRYFVDHYRDFISL
jgi:hypothetical protein